MFADDIKLYRVVSFYNNDALLQSDLNLLFKWCRNNFIILNIVKCQVIHFSRSRDHIKLYLDKLTLLRLLEYFFNLYSNMFIHINPIKNKALKLLGLIYRNCVDFNDNNAFIYIY